jgi:hypothetical protein
MNSVSTIVIQLSLPIVPKYNTTILIKDEAKIYLMPHILDTMFNLLLNYFVTHPSATQGEDGVERRNYGIA